MRTIIGLILALLLSSNAFAQNTSRYFGGDYKYTPNEFTINANTANGADTGRMNITGGGGTGTSTARGGYVSVYGADRGGAGAGGDVILTTADNGDILLNVTGAAGYIDFNTNNLQKFFIAPTADLDSELYYGRTNVANWYAKVLAATSDGGDSGRFTISGGGAVGTTRGGRIDFYGADRGGAGLGGDINIMAADSGDILLEAINNGDIVLNTVGAGGYIDFQTANEQKWFIAPTVTTISELYFGILGVPNWEARILNSSNDGTDSGRLSLSGGGALGVTRGGRIDLYGADRGGAGLGGDIVIQAADQGDVSIRTSGTGGGNVVLDAGGATGYINFESGGEQKWFIRPTVATYSELFFGIVGGAVNWEGRVAAATVAGADTSRLLLLAGGGTSASRGAFLDLNGSDRGGVNLGGGAILGSSDNANVSLSATGGYIDFQIANEQKWFIAPTVTKYSELYYGNASVGADWEARILAPYADGADTGKLVISGGGGIGTTRGARMTLYGSDRGGAGLGGGAYIEAGDSGNIELTTHGTGTVQIYDFGAGGIWRGFGPIGTAGTCTFVNGDYAVIVINSVSRRLAVCDL